MTLETTITSMSKQEYDSLTEDEKHVIVYELGLATLGLIYAVNQLGHRTLGGHLYYQNADTEQPESVPGQLIKWLRWITAQGTESKEKIGKPSWLINFSIWQIGARLFS